MSRCARNNKPPLIASEMTAIAVPRTVQPGSCVHLSPIGQPTSHSPAAIRYAQAIATLASAPFAIRATLAKDDSRFVTAGRRSGGRHGWRRRSRVAQPLRPQFCLDTLKLRDRLQRTTRKQGNNDGGRLLHLQVARVVDEADTAPLSPGSPQ